MFFLNMCTSKFVKKVGSLNIKPEFIYLELVNIFSKIQTNFPIFLIANDFPLKTYKSFDEQ